MMGGMKDQLYCDYQPRQPRRQRSGVVSLPPENSLNAGLHLRPNGDHYISVCLPGDGRDIPFNQNQMNILLELVREAQREILVDDSRSDRQHACFVPLGAGGRL